MSPSFVDLTSALAASAGVASAMVGLVASRRAYRRSQKDIENLQDEFAVAALNSSDIDQVGAYLFDRIGSVRIGDYVRDDKVRRRTGMALSRFTEFLGPKPASIPVPPVPWTPPEESASGELVQAEHRILEGEVWNGLAQMRRHVEMKLLQSTSASPSARLGAGQLISLAEKSGTLSGDAALRLRYAVSVANKAIHGEPVDVEVALEALQSARNGLSRLQATGRGHPNAEA